MYNGHDASAESAACDCDYLLKCDIDDIEPHYDNCRTRLLRRDDAAQYRRRYPKNPDGSLVLPNKHLASLERDVLYHLALSTDDNLHAKFGDVKFVCMGGTAHRMEEFARHMATELGVVEPLVDLTAASHRYAMYKVGPVLSVSHGVGSPSESLLLQEILKLLQYARARAPLVFRIGTSGGLDIPPGTVVVSTFAMSGTLSKTYELPVLGKMVSWPALFDRRLAREVMSVASENDGFATVAGGTFAADDFYRGQARMDGPFCDHTEEQKMAFLRTLRDRGVRNIEMEATSFAAFTREAAVRAADVCVTFIDRMHGDQITSTKETMLEWQRRPMIIVGRFIKRVIDSGAGNHQL